MKDYSEDFYDKRHEATVYSARTVLSILSQCIPRIESAVDVGCGVGTWLSVLKEKAAKEILGVDGGWVNQDLLVIPSDCFRQVDLTQKSSFPRRYDLAISLEVAEHLPPTCANEFVAMLTELSDYVLFSAAIPGQGGVNHINEQWHEYWVKLFASHGYDVHDLIRSRIWDDSEIPFWYRQNIFLFSKQEKSENIRSRAAHLGAPLMPLDAVHPDLYRHNNAAKGDLESVERQLQQRHEMGVQCSFQLFVESLKKYVAKKFF